MIRTGDSYGPSPVSGGVPSPPLMIEGPGRPPSAPVGPRGDPFGKFMSPRLLLSIQPQSPFISPSTYRSLFCCDGSLHLDSCSSLFWYFFSSFDLLYLHTCFSPMSFIPLPCHPDPAFNCLQLVPRDRWFPLMAMLTCRIHQLGSGFSSEETPPSRSWGCVLTSLWFCVTGPRLDSHGRYADLGQPMPARPGTTLHLFYTLLTV